MRWHTSRCFYMRNAAH